jgi:histone demethylase JARID1
MDNIGPLFQNENSLLHALQKVLILTVISILWSKCILSTLKTSHDIFQINQTLDRSLYIYGKLQIRKEPNLCNCCFVNSEDQESLICSTCMDR